MKVERKAVMEGSAKILRGDSEQLAGGTLPSSECRQSAQFRAPALLWLREPHRIPMAGCARFSPFPHTEGRSGLRCQARFEFRVADGHQKSPWRQDILSKSPEPCACQPSDNIGAKHYPSAVAEWSGLAHPNADPFFCSRYENRNKESSGFREPRPARAGHRTPATPEANPLLETRLRCCRRAFLGSVLPPLRFHEPLGMSAETLVVGSHGSGPRARW